MLLFGCGSRKAVTASQQESNSQLSTQTDDVRQSASTINTETKTDQSGTTETTTTKTDFTPMVDPKTGNIVPVKTHEVTTTTKQSNKEQKQESKQEKQQANQTSKSSSHAASADKQKSRDVVKANHQSGNLKHIAWIGTLLLGLIVWIKYKPPAFISKLFKKN
ncbi:MAG: hypothetical protein JXR39_11615 [Marinilabiliaceae bacterium]|nr:hypothetical protein [Marinilabiliaceae bacterium]